MKKILILIVVFCLISICIFIYSSTLALTNVDIVNKNVISNKIPKDLNGIKLVYISDILYGEFMDEKRLTNMIDEINNTDADIIVFGGDLLSDQVDISKINKITLLSLLKKIEAPLGKFAVLGDNDILTEEKQKFVSDLLYAADFEVLRNQCLPIYNKGESSINLIGLDNYLNGNKDYSNALKTINNNDYNLLISHCPDVIKSKEINPTHIDMILSGHSLGGQIYIPIFSMFQDIDGAGEYHRGTYYIDKCELIVSNGLGTTDNDLRIFTPPQIHIFHFQSLSKKENKTQTPKDEQVHIDKESSNTSSSLEQNNEETKITDVVDDTNQNNEIDNSDIQENETSDDESYNE